MKSVKSMAFVVLLAVCAGCATGGNREVIEFRAKDMPKVLSPRTAVQENGAPRPVAYHLKGVSDKTLDFGGAEILLHGKIQPFLLEDCTNVTIRNVSVRYDRCPFTDGRIRSCTDRELTLEVPKEFPLRIKGQDLYFVADDWSDGPIDRQPVFLQCFDGRTRRGAEIALAFFAGKVDADTSLPWTKDAIRFTARMENGLLVLTSDRSLEPWSAGMKAGNYVVIGHSRRTHSSCEMVQCKNVKIENYRVLNGIAMGIFAFHCENVTLDGLKFVHDESSPSIASNGADAIHAFSCSGDFIVRNSVIEGMIDDGLNVHGNYYVVESVSGNEITAFTAHEPQATAAIFCPGDRISVKLGKTLDESGEYTIKAVRAVDAKHVVFTLDRPVGNHKQGDLIENLSAQCNLKILNSRFGKANTHLRLQTRGGVLIDGCEIELPVLLTGDANFWYESSPCEKVVIRNTKFLTNMGFVRSWPEFTPTEKHPYYHGDIVIENCTFESGEPFNGHGYRSVKQ